MSLRNIKLAVDRSMRRTDADGHMHVERTHISKANVCPYYGREIPDFEALGLDANRVYRLWRHPEELRAGAASFAGKPLLLHHQPVSVDEHPRELVVGSIGTDVTFDGTYLDAPLSLWTAEGIEAVESKEQRELSPGYRYRADMTPGHTPQGVAFDGIMRDIKGNHLALVREGRTGPDVLVADALPIGLSKMKFSKVMAALAAFLPTMQPEHAVALDAALDADLEVSSAMDALTDEEKTGACDAWAKEKGKAMDALTDEDKAEAFKRAAADKKSRAPAAATATTAPHAADEAAVKLAVDTAVAAALDGKVAKADADKLAQDAATAARAEVHALYDARKAVEATVGVVALDSAEAVFRFALDHLKVEHKDIAAPALAALYDSSAKAAAAPPVQIASDNAAVFDISSIYTKG
jgi:hypothetical protein